MRPRLDQEDQDQDYETKIKTKTSAVISQFLASACELS